MKVDWLIVGAGFTGLVLAERIASQLGKKVLVVERRDSVGSREPEKKVLFAGRLADYKY